MALKWFKPDLLLMEDPSLCPLWMDNFKGFVLELQINFGPHGCIRDAKHQLDHLSIKDGQRTMKYVVEFNRIALQIWGYREGALWHHFYNGLPNYIKHEVSYIGKPLTLTELCQLTQAIDVCYWKLGLLKVSLNPRFEPEPLNWTLKFRFGSSSVQPLSSRFCLWFWTRHVHSNVVWTGLNLSEPSTQ